MPGNMMPRGEKPLKRGWISELGTLTSRKVSKQIASMDEFEIESAQALKLIQSFGAFRNVEVTIGDDVYSAERCDDAPVMKLVRIREFEVRMMLQDLRIQQKDGFKKRCKEATTQMNALIDRQGRAVTAIKEASKQFKTDIRSLSTTEKQALETQKAAIKDVLDSLGNIKADALKLINELRIINSKKGYNYSEYASQVMPKQAEKWRERWLQTSKVVNEIVGAQWAKAERDIRDDARSADAPSAVAEEKWRLDYIGSLAKGVKGPPKQHIAFDPDKFDVDANLDAPSLSSWAVERGSVADRGRLWGRKDTNLQLISALQRFQDLTHRELSEIPGYDADDPFEVVVTADVTPEDDMYEWIKESIIKLKRMAPESCFVNFVRRSGVREMLDSDDVPKSDCADDLYIELETYARENGFYFSD